MSKKEQNLGTLSGGARAPSRQRTLKTLRALLTDQPRSQTVTEDHILSVLLVRRARAALLGTELFSDPAWDLMLELYAAHLGERTVCLSDLAAAIDTPESTTARWLGALNQHGLTDAAIDPVQPSHMLICLTPEGLAKMQQLADRWVSAFVSI